MKTDKVVLGDTKEYTITIFDVGDLIAIEEKYGTMQVAMDKMEPMLFWLYLSLKKIHKELTQEKLYELVDIKFIQDGRLNDIFTKLVKLNGWDSVEGKEVKNDSGPAKKE